jgi:hypothetical protein
VGALETVRDLEHAPLARHALERRLRLQSATSSPNMTMRGLRAISSFIVRLMAATIVSGLPSGAASVSNVGDVGSTSGE